VKIISGIFPKTSGDIFIEGKEVKEYSPIIAMKNFGITLVPQNVEFHTGMTVKENLFINDLPFKLGFVDNKKMFNETKGWFEKFSLDISPNALMESTSFVQKKVILIIKALKENSKILILDEPTASLHFQEKELLFDYIREFNKKGVTFIYISHHLDEVFAICDRVTILKDGKIVSVKNVKETNKAEIVEQMIGKKEAIFIKSDKKVDAESSIEIIGFEDKNLVHDININIKKGEILSIVGIKGCGKEELIDYIFGRKKRTNGRLIILGKEVKKISPDKSLYNGICLLPEDRKGMYLFIDKSIKENIAFSNIKKILNRFGFLNRRKENNLAAKYKNEFDIKAPSLEKEVQFLSGGNQQKVAFAKAINTDPKVLILHEPTVGIDVGTRLEIHQMIEDLTKEGLSILLISSDIEEVTRVSDRILVMFNGTITKEVKRTDKEFNEKDIILLMEGAAT
ncbi:MAG: sugar ABC transporter ATP-binding protein, partial [Candidatus Humimicrobiaceae bacterium]